MIPETDGRHLHLAATHLYNAAIAEQDRAETLMRPSYLLKPRLSIDGNKWCALYGDNLQDGVAGFGKSPSEAYIDFDRAWQTPLQSINNSGLNITPLPEYAPMLYKDFSANSETRASQRDCAE